MEKNLGFVEFGSVLPKIAYTVCRLQVYERVRISVISVCKTTQKGYKYGLKNRSKLVILWL